jgi:trehalose-phosphatase
MTTDLSMDLSGAGDDLVDRVATTRHLLVASDFDGVLAPIVADPAASAPLPDSVDALAGLAARPDTTVALVSGREVRQLRSMVPAADRFVLIGSHGAEVVNDPTQADNNDRTDRTADGHHPSDEQRRRLQHLVTELEGLTGDLLGLFVEAKQVSVAVHFRRVVEEQREAAAQAVAAFEATWPGRVVRGKEVVEFAVGHADKGQAVQALAARAGATATVYLGDDVTDEDVFAVLGPDDLGVKVGPGPTGANRRVASPAEVTGLLQYLRDRRG